MRENKARFSRRRPSLQPLSQADRTAVADFVRSLQVVAVGATAKAIPLTRQAISETQAARLYRNAPFGGEV